VKILVIVNESPWGSSLSLAALRLVRAITAGGTSITAVYFRDEGVYHSLDGAAADSGTVRLNGAWRDLSRAQGIPLLLCSAAAQRRLETHSGEGFREAGLAEVLELMASSDRVVTF
jgi:tRNA 2-thiouridine synthesizing protein D